MSTSVRPPAAPPPAAPPPEREPEGRRRPVAAAMVLITIGLVWALVLLGVAIPWSWVLPLALVVVGGALLVVRPAASGGLVALGVVLVVLSVVLLPLRGSMAWITGGGVGDRTVVVTDVGQLEDLELGAGQLVVDLRELPVTAGEVIEVPAAIGVGEIRVRLPEGAGITGTGRAGIGEVRGPDASRGGLGIQASFADLADEGTDGPTFDLDLQVGVGSIRVDR